MTDEEKKQREEKKRRDAERTIQNIRELYEQSVGHSPEQSRKQKRKEKK